MVWDGLCTAHLYTVLLYMCIRVYILYTIYTIYKYVYIYITQNYGIFTVECWCVCHASGMANETSEHIGEDYRYWS